MLSRLEGYGAACCTETILMRRQRACTHLLRGWDWTASVALEDLVEVWRNGAVVDDVLPVDSPRHENKQFGGGPALG